MATLRAPRDKYDHDPLVPIVPARLRAALRHREISARAAANKVDRSQQTIDAIIRSAESRRCRKSTRDKLSSLLRYPPEWLSGATDWLPVTVWTAQSQESGHPYLTDENSVYYRRKPDGTPELPLEEELSHDLPDRQLAAWDLSERILVAWRRDLSAGRKDAQKAWAELAGVSDDGDHVRVAVQRLLALTWWERLFTRDRSPRISVALPPVDDSEGPAIAKARRERAKELSRMDGFAVAFSEGIEVVLEPWLSGSTSVDYGTITEVMRWVGEGMMTPSQRERLMALMQSHDPEE